MVSVFNYNNGPSYRCLFPTLPKDGSIANCSEAGVLGVLPGIIGTMQANEVLKIKESNYNIMKLVESSVPAQKSPLDFPQLPLGTSD